MEYTTYLCLKLFCIIFRELSVSFFLSALKIHTSGFRFPDIFCKKNDTIPWVFCCQPTGHQVWVAAETGRVCYTEADVAKMKARNRWVNLHAAGRGYFFQMDPMTMAKRKKNSMIWTFSTEWDPLKKSFGRNKTKNDGKIRDASLELTVLCHINFHVHKEKLPNTRSCLAFPTLQALLTSLSWIVAVFLHHTKNTSECFMTHAWHMYLFVSTHDIPLWS